MKTDNIISILASTKLPTMFGEFQFNIFKTPSSLKHHIFITAGNIEKSKKPLLVRIHSQCLTSECFLSLKCDCREQLHESMRMIQKEECGLIIYLKQEGRGIGLVNKIKAYKLQEQGFDTVEANHKLGFLPDERNYKAAVDLLSHLRISRIRLMSNNPMKLGALEKAGITIAQRIPLQIKPNGINKKYLETKKKKLGHLLDI